MLGTAMFDFYQLMANAAEKLEHREDKERHRLRRAQVPTRKRQSESLNDVSSNGSFHDEGAHLPALLSNFDNFISREKTPRYGSRSRKSPVNPIVAGELGRPRRPNVDERAPQLRGKKFLEAGKFS